jgi:wobble nucleotide-excising tRNase
MPLSKIIAIKNVGRLKSSAIGGDTTFAKHTFIFGANGFGKTTLCSILRSLKAGDASYIVGRKTLGAANDPSVDILIAGTNHRFDAGAWNNTHPNFAIYDGIFTAENVHSGDAVDTDQKRNLYRVIIGDAGVTLATQEAKLASDARIKTGEISATMKAIQSHVPAGIKPLDFMALENIVNIDGEITKQEAKLTTVREAATIQAKPVLVPLTMPAMPAGLTDLLAMTIVGIAKDAEQRIVKHLAAHDMADAGNEWIIHGLDHTDKTCPFCNQGVEGSPLIAAYKAVFSDSYKGLRDRISAAQKRIEQTFGDNALGKFDAFAAQHNGAVEFWSRYCTLDTAALTYPTSIVQILRNLCIAAQSLADKKATSPLEALTPDEAYTKAIADYESEKIKVEAFNQAIGQANVLIEAKKTEASAGDIAAVQTELTRLRAIKVRHSSNVAQLCSDHARQSREKIVLENQKTLVRERLDQHTASVVQPYQDRINDLLDDFNAGFRIAETRHSYTGGVATSSYQLVINDTAIDIGAGDTPNDTPSFKNTLSAGDRSVLSLAFFLAHLERDPALASKVVVFDDPFNSQDAFRRRQTIHEILKIARRCAQVIVLSHDATFLKQIWEKCAPGARASIALADYGRDGSKISAIDLEMACRGRTASDTDDLQAYCTTGAGQLIDIIRKMRTVLETYMRTNYPTSFNENDYLGEIVGKIRTGGVSHPAQSLYDDLNEINDYTTQYHHGEDPHDATPDIIDPTELRGFAKRTLKIMKAFQG